MFTITFLTKNLRIIDRIIDIDYQLFIKTGWYCYSLPGNNNFLNKPNISIFRLGTSKRMQREICVTAKLKNIS